MWHRFTERARRVIFLGQEEAVRRGEKNVATEHLLLGLLGERDAIALRVLDRLGVDRECLRAEIEWRLPAGERRYRHDMRLTPEAAHGVDRAYEEARRLGCTYLGTEHLLLGLLADEHGAVASLLRRHGVTLESARHETCRLRSDRSRELAPAAAPGGRGDEPIADPP